MTYWFGTQDELEHKNLLNNINNTIIQSRWLSKVGEGIQHGCPQMQFENAQLDWN